MQPHHGQMTAQRLREDTKYVDYSAGSGVRRTHEPERGNWSCCERRTKSTMALPHVFGEFDAITVFI
jgi:hypothetical protein